MDLNLSPILRDGALKSAIADLSLKLPSRVNPTSVPLLRMRTMGVALPDMRSK
jgi:hypothetical protein